LRASSSTDVGVAGWAVFVLSQLSAACSPTLVSIMATSCLANVGLRGGRVALIPARMILRRRGCLASPKASPRSGVGGRPFFDVACPSFGLPTGNRYEVTGITIQRFDDYGKIVEDWAVFDALGMMRQLGFIPDEPEQQS
jgi:hypothetical protein